MTFKFEYCLFACFCGLLHLFDCARPEGVRVRKQSRQSLEFALWVIHFNISSLPFICEAESLM